VETDDVKDGDGAGLAAAIEARAASDSTAQGGLLTRGHGHYLAWVFASGRRAGRYAALERQTTTSLNGARDK
jgi:hypothetical protein